MTKNDKSGRVDAPLYLLIVIDAQYIWMIGCGEPETPRAINSLVWKYASHINTDAASFFGQSNGYGAGSQGLYAAIGEMDRSSIR